MKTHCKLILLVTAIGFCSVPSANAKTSRPPKLENMSIEAMRVELTRLQLEREKALHSYFPTSQYVRRIEQKIAKLRQQLSQLEHNQRLHPGSFTPPSFILCHDYPSSLRK